MKRYRSQNLSARQLAIIATDLEYGVPAKLVAESTGLSIHHVKAIPTKLRSFGANLAYRNRVSLAHRAKPTYNPDHHTQYVKAAKLINTAKCMAHYQELTNFNPKVVSKWPTKEHSIIWTDNPTPEIKKGFFSRLLDRVAIW